MNDQRCDPCNKEGLNVHTLGLHVRGKKHLEKIGMSAPLVEVATDQECETCSISGMTETNFAIHEKSDRHLEAVAINVVAEDRVYPADLQAAIDAYDMDPRDRAKMVRAAFSVRDWPNDSHPGSIRDFLEENNIPFFDLPPHVTWADGKNYSNAASREIMRTGAFNPDKEQDGK